MNMYGKMYAAYSDIPESEWYDETEDKEQQS